MAEKKGMFAVICKETGKALICFSSISIRAAITRQMSMLRLGTHYNHEMQADYNTMGEDAFQALILEECEPNQIIHRKQYWLESWRNHYNPPVTGSTRIGAITEEGRKKLSILKRGEGNPMVKLTEKDVFVVRKLLKEKMTYRAIARAFDVHHTTIRNIGVGKTWTHLQ